MALPSLKAKLDSLMLEDELQTVIGTRRRMTAAGIGNSSGFGGNANATNNAAIITGNISTSLRRFFGESEEINGDDDEEEIERHLEEARLQRRMATRREAEAAAAAAAAAAQKLHDDAASGTASFKVGNAKPVDRDLRALRYELRKLMEADSNNPNLKRTLSQPQHAMSTANTTPTGAASRSRHASLLVVQTGAGSDTASNTTPSSAAISPTADELDQPRRSLEQTMGCDDPLGLSLTLPNGAQGRVVVAGGATSTARALQARRGRRGSDRAAAEDVDDEPTPGALRRTAHRHGGGKGGERSLLDYVQQRIEAERAQQAKHAAELEAARAAAQAAEEYEARYAAMRRKLREAVLEEVFGAAFVEEQQRRLRDEMELSDRLRREQNAGRIGGEEGLHINFNRPEFHVLSADPSSTLEQLIDAAKSNGLWATLLQNNPNPLPLQLTISSGGGNDITGDVSPLTSRSPPQLSSGIMSLSTTDNNTNNNNGQNGNPGVSPRLLLRVVPLDDVVEVMSEGTLTHTGFSPNATTTICTSEHSINADTRADILTELDILRRDVMQLEREEEIVAQRLMRLERQASSPTRAAGGEGEPTRRALPFVDAPVGASRQRKHAEKAETSQSEASPPPHSPVLLAPLPIPPTLKATVNVDGELEARRQRALENLRKIAELQQQLESGEK